MNQFKAKSASLISALLCVLATPVLAQSGDTSERGAGSMTGYEETPSAINSPGSGEFFIHVHPDRTALDYELRYRGLTGVTQSHIHFGRPGVSASCCTSVPTLPRPRGCRRRRPARRLKAFLPERSRRPISSRRPDRELPQATRDSRQS